ncbi:mucosal pentraxin-like [Hyperolius riggenbachi]|uniref:mucosal pentraxin-like n=1 Tax=Hyperolius riggenbachi TaxID=752182 RepID=UPI0035A2F2A1
MEVDLEIYLPYGKKVMKVIICLFFLAKIPGILGQTDMNGKAFYFYQKDNGPVKVSPKTFKTFTAFTLCLKSCTNLTENMLMFKMFNTTSMNKFALLLDANPSTFTGGDVLIFYKGLKLSFHLPIANSNEWRNICVAFDSSSGRLLFWLNGELYRSEELQTGLTKFVPMGIVIGSSYVAQETSSVAQITDVNVWSKVLTSDDMETAITKKTGGDVINWNLLNYNARGPVTIGSYRCSVNS